MHEDLICRLRESAEALANEIDTRKEAADALEALRADAERYRALRGSHLMLTISPDQLDAAIDAVRSTTCTKT